MYYTVYKTVNKLNGKYYIGIHQTKKVHDAYLGSGKAMKDAIAKYGKKSFTKEVLFVFDNREEMLDKEVELVNDDIVQDDMSYNMRHGGQGYLAGKDNPQYGVVWTAEQREEHSKLLKGRPRPRGKECHNYGKVGYWTGKKRPGHGARMQETKRINKLIGQQTVLERVYPIIEESI